ncbi:MAG: SH3 domain-containing protein [Pyrinomonadaceae bacterium MAG19_C2-C3]|nr:SH3 domain-containing protein [Pyrinomonadaceae bacterium MAG19_C2-C3]
MYTISFSRQAVLLFVSVVVLSAPCVAQRRRAASNGNRTAYVVDERLAALRSEPKLEGDLTQRLSRGRAVQIIGNRQADGAMFYRVAVTRRTRGWLPADALVSPTRVEDDARLLRLIRGSDDFDKLDRASLFLQVFPRSSLRAQVLSLVGEEAEQFAQSLSREAARRLNEKEMTAGGASRVIYFMNYNGLDRFNKIGVKFKYDEAARAFKYDGAAWREIVRRYPNSAEAETARAKLAALSNDKSR